jgi:hypothetical protein
MSALSEGPFEYAMDCSAQDTDHAAVERTLEGSALATHLACQDQARADQQRAARREAALLRVRRKALFEPDWADLLTALGLGE